MSGHVFHPGHEELHGVTVVVRSRSGRTWVGRYHERNDRGVVLRDAGVHDPATAALDGEAWLERQRRFGIQVEQRLVVVPIEEVAAIEWLSKPAEG